MNNLLLVFVFVLCALLLLAVTQLFFALSRTRRELERLSDRIQLLQQGVDRQEARISQVHQQYAARKDDVLLGLLEVVLGWRKKGLMPVLGVFALRSVASYWKDRKKRALPAKLEERL